MPGRIRVLIADDHAAVRSALASSLLMIEDVEVVGQAASGEAAVELAVQLDPDVVLMDVSMPGIGGIQATRRITSAGGSHPRVVGLSMYEGDIGDQICDAGAITFISKDAALEVIAEAVRFAASSRRQP